MGVSHDIDLKLPVPPEASAVARRWARRLVTPIEAFLHIEAASGIVLLVAAAAAMIVANSRLADEYHHLLELPLGLRAGSFVIERPLHFWINDGLMTIFFFVVGLEIRREIHEGELATFRRAALPVVAAVGGMIAPALLYLAVTHGHPEVRRGWGVSMATDIAFAVGVLALLGKRVPPALRVLLLALAIIDDIGSILVIALFYTGSVEPSGLLTIGAGLLGIVLLQRLGVRRASIYVLPGMVVWLGFLQTGVHPTIGGVVVGMLTPVRSWLGATGLVELARRAVAQVELETNERGRISPERLAEEMAYIELARREALSPALRLQRTLHPWVAFGIMPLFAFANAGVSLEGSATSLGVVGAGVVCGLVAGKPIGVLGACALAVRMRIAALPMGIGWRELPVLGVVAGIGFTMSLFVAALAFPDSAHLAAAKLGILLASVVAISLGLLTGRLLLRPRPALGAATEEEAERSDEV